MKNISTLGTRVAILFAVILGVCVPMGSAQDMQHFAIKIHDFTELKVVDGINDD